MGYGALPGGDLVEKGLLDLEGGVVSIEALLVSTGAPRLRAAGLEIRATVPDPEHSLYALLAGEGSDAAHSRYNALMRRLVAFESALECGA